MAETDRAGKWLADHPKTLDLALTVVVLAIFEMPAFDPYRHDSRQWWPAWGFLIAAPLLWRRSRPLETLAVSLTGSAGALLTRAGPNWGALSQATMFIGPAAALASAAASLPTLVSRWAALLVAAVIVGLTLVRGSAPDALIAQLVIVGAAWAIGEAFRARRHEVTLLRELVDQRAEQAANDERNRIARELHDVVAHQLAVIAIQAGATRLSAGADSSAVNALAAIEHASQAALDDVRRVLGVLRGDHTGGVAPQPGLELLDDLAGRLRHAGLPVELTTIGDLTAVPRALGVSTYRIVQEALTNVLNHAGAVATTVLVARHPSALELDVRNDAPVVRRRPPAGLEGGHGLVGIRERVAAFNGTLAAGPLPTGGFSVTAHIPLT